MRQVLIPVIGAVFIIAVLSAVLADCDSGAGESRDSSGAALPRYP
jgi:hypothetical protein